jgi:hypothetical protein
MVRTVERAFGGALRLVEEPVLLEERSNGTEEDGCVLLVRVDVAAADLDESLRG